MDIVINQEDIHLLEETTEDLLEIKYITKENAAFEKTKGGFISLEFEGVRYDRVDVYRTFPFSDANSFISVREPDEKAKEIGMIKELNCLGKNQENIIREQLEIRYFTPIIEKIYDIKDEYGYAYFDVKTNHGACKFTIHMGGGSIVSLSDTRILIQDIDNNRFEIPDITKFSSMELKKLDLFI